MSRCFPYPPPGYTLSGASKEALIESIKLQKEKEKAKDKEQRKEKKKEKEERKKDKEKRKEKKEKRKEEKEKKREKKGGALQNLDKSDIVHGHKKFPAGANSDHLHKGSKVEPEQLERSTLTEEHGQAVHLRVPSTSSDSTENSNKRKRESSPTVTRGHGKIIRIRLSSNKQNKPDASANEQQLCSTSGRSEFHSQDKDNIALRHHRENFCSTSNKTDNSAKDVTLRSNPEQICLTSQPIDTVPSGRTRIPPATNAVMTKMQKRELEYKNLFENLIPLQLQDMPLGLDDQDWLFQGKKDVRVEKRQTPVQDTTPSSSIATLWPRAQHLPEVDVYVLPFTVPF